MSISFSGVGSGLPIDEWITALVKVKQDKVDVMTKQQEVLQKKQTALDTLKSEYNLIRSDALKFTDSLYGAGTDIFTKVSVSVSETSIVTASVTQLGTPASFDLDVSQLATSTTRKSDINNVFKDSSKKLSELGVTNAGNFEINGATINVTPDMTVDGLVYQINNSSTAGVKASLEKGQLVIRSKDSGNKDITVTGTDKVDGIHNFAQLIGLDNNDATHLTKGTKAVFKIDGVEKTSDSNSLTSADTGILGLSLDLLSTTDAGEPVTVTIGRDYDSEAPLTAIQEFVKNFNKAITDTDAGTDLSKGLLTSENSLVNIRNSLRTLITAEVSSTGKYKSLSDIGITTGAPGMDVNADTTQLVIDKDKFLAAFDKDPAAVKALLVGNNTTGATTDGIMQKVQTSLKPALDTSSGYFAARTESLQSQIKSMSEQINKKQNQVSTYKDQLTKQFNYMDQQIAKMNQQFAQMQQQLSQIGVNVGGK